MRIVFMATFLIRRAGEAPRVPTVDLKRDQGLFAVPSPTLCLHDERRARESTSPSDFLRGLAKGVANPDRHLPARPAPPCERQHAVWPSVPAHCFRLPLPSARRAGH